jgi:hypothetical protein
VTRRATGWPDGHSLRVCGQRSHGGDDGGRVDVVDHHGADGRRQYEEHLAVLDLFVALKAVEYRRRFEGGQVERQGCGTDQGPLARLLLGAPQAHGAGDLADRLAVQVGGVDAQGFDDVAD